MYYKKISKLNLLKENIILKIKDSFEINYDNKLKQLSIISTIFSTIHASEKVKITLDFDKKRIYDLDYYRNNQIINKEGLSDIKILEDQKMKAYYHATTYNLLINICIWLLELDDKKRMIFAINMNSIKHQEYSIVDFKDENLSGNKGALLTLLKKYSALMKRRLDEDTNNIIYYNTLHALKGEPIPIQE